MRTRNWPSFRRVLSPCNSKLKMFTDSWILMFSNALMKVSVKRTVIEIFWMLVNFAFSRSATGKFDCFVYEMLFIKELRPSLNTQSDSIIDLLTVLTSRQPRDKLRCLYENLMSKNFRKTAVLKKIWIVN